MSEQNAVPSSPSMPEVSSSNKTANRLLVITAILGFLVGYSHFFGLSYRKGYMEGLGFHGISFNLSTEESIYYAMDGIGHFLLSLWKIEWLIWIPVVALIVFGLFSSYQWVRLKYFREKKVEENKGDESDDKPEFTMKGFWKALKNDLRGCFYAGFMGGIVGAASHTFLMVGTLALIFVFWAFGALGIQIGIKQGNELLGKLPCSILVWPEVKNDVVLGCIQWKAKNGKSLVGIRVHQDARATYFLTNEGAYEISPKGEIISFRPIHRRPEEKKDKAEASD